MDRIAKSLILLVAALVLVPGCFAEENTTEAVATPTVEEVIELANTTEATETVESVNETIAEDVVEAVVPDFTVNETVETIDMDVNQTVAIELTANEENGEWLTNMTEGLEQVGNATITNGTETWLIKAITAGDQTFNATQFSNVSGESATGAGETYNLGIVVA